MESIVYFWVIWGLRVGVVIPNMVPYAVDVGLLRECAEVADENGVYALLVWDHYSLPWGDETFDAWVVLAYLSSFTSRIKLGTCVTPIPFRHPAALAKIVASVDVLSGGRVVLGVGAGWYRPEFTGFAEWYGGGERVSRTVEGVRIIKELWSRGRLDYSGRYYRVRDAVVLPPPVQRPHPPMWFGTNGRRMLRAAVRYGNGWIPTMTPPREYAETRDEIRGMLKKEGKTDFTFAYADFDTHDIPKGYMKIIEQYEDAGCEVYLATWRYQDREKAINNLRKFAEEVIPSYNNY